MYHINPEKGPKICRARSGHCPYGVDAPHFNTFEEAMESYNSHLSNLNVFTKKKVDGGVSNTVYQPLFHYTSKKNVFTNDLKKLDESLSDLDVDAIEDYIVEHGVYEDVKRLIGARTFKSMSDRERLNKINPRSGVSGAEVSEKVYKEFLKNYHGYINHTGVLMEALSSNPKSLNNIKKLSQDVKIGGAIMVRGNENVLNGEIISLMAAKEYSNDFKPFDELKLKSLIEKKDSYGKNKTTSQNTFNDTPLKTNGGAVYRENVMKRFALNDIAEKAPFNVYENNNYYSNIKEPTQIVKPFAFTSSKDSSNDKPDGILEIVKANSSGEISLKDRANILYTLNALSLDKASVRAINGENKYFDTVIERNGELVDGVKMKDFIHEKFNSQTFKSDGGEK